MAQGGDAKAGKAVYDKSCVACHAADGSAKEAVAKMLKVEIPHLGAKDVQAKSDADLKKSVTDGVGKMKPVKGLADKDVANVIAFVRTLKQ
jgi:mono/diheme cytochrome c family protein